MDAGRFPRLHVLTDVRPDRDALAAVDAALRAGAPAIQVRVKGMSDRDHHAFAVAVATRCRAAGALCLVNDRVDIALACGADGVHLGADDLPVDVVRGVAGDRLIVGGTARDPDAARRLVSAGADYLGVGPTFATTTKEGLPAPLGVERVGAVAAAVDVPVLAIAGITVERVPEVLAVGVHGVAVVGAVTRAPDPAAATRALLDQLEAARAGST